MTIMVKEICVQSGNYFFRILVGTLFLKITYFLPNDII